MTASKTADVMSRRSELLAELFLTELGATVTRSPSDVVDLLAFFETENKALQIMAVEVKTTKSPLPEKFPLSIHVVERAAEFNIPTLLLVVDAKQNRFGFAWLNEIAKSSRRSSNKSQVLVPLLEAEKEKESIREHLSSFTAA